ncbi:MAG: M23 family metallopeptidase [Betaproteobacteria bacterium]
MTRLVDTEHQIIAENDGPAPITVRVTIAGENFATDLQWPVTAIVPPHSVLTLGRVRPAGPVGANYRIRCEYNYHFGRADAVHDGRELYRLPFEDGRGFAVSQAYGGRLTSHDNIENRYAVDFAMPVGSMVTAARDGVVIDVNSHYHEGSKDPGFRDKANTVAVAHDDGTIAEYAHLAPGPAIVAAGQRVAAGELLGYSGSTGFTTGPHLHFVVSRPSISKDRISRASVPVVFYTGNRANSFSARAGATVWASYGDGTRATRTAIADPDWPARSASVGGL